MNHTGRTRPCCPPCGSGWRAGWRLGGSASLEPAEPADHPRGSDVVGDEPTIGIACRTALDFY